MIVVVALLASGLSPIPHRWLPQDIRILALRQRMWSVLERIRLASIATYADVDRILPELKCIVTGIEGNLFAGHAENDVGHEDHPAVEH